MARRRKLTEEAQLYVVQALACFESLPEVRAAVQKEWGVEVTVQALQRYDPTTKAGEGGREKWLSIFEATRKEYLENSARIAISHRAVRLAYLDRVAKAAFSRNNFQQVMAAVELAEKVTGRFFNRPGVAPGDGKGGEAAATGRIVFYRPSSGRRQQVPAA